MIFEEMKFYLFKLIWMGNKVVIVINYDMNLLILLFIKFYYI